MARWKHDEREMGLDFVPTLAMEKAALDFNKACNELGIEMSVLRGVKSKNKRPLTTKDERDAMRYLIRGEKVPDDLRNRLLEAKRQRELENNQT